MLFNFRKKCYICYLPFKQSYFDEKFCLSKLVQNKYYECVHCSKIITNNQCLERHLKLSKTLCKMVQFCKSCFTLYRGKNHKCDTKLCRICFHIHKMNQEFCTMRVRRTRIKSTINFIGKKFKNTICIFEYGNDCNNYFLFDISNKCVKTMEFNTDGDLYCNRIEGFENFHILNIINYFDVNNLSPTLYFDQELFNKSCEDIDNQECNYFMTSNRSINQIKLKYLNIRLISDLIPFQPILLCWKFNIQNISPFLTSLPSCITNNSEIQSLENVKVKCFTTNIFSSDKNILQFVEESSDKDLLRIRQMSVPTFINHYLCTTILLQHRFIGMVKNYLNNLRMKHKSLENLNIDLFSYKTFNAMSQNIFLQSLQHELLPIFPRQV